MRVLFFSRLFYPHIGGVEKHVAEISKRLARLGYQVGIITEELNTVISKPKSKKIKVYRIPIGASEKLKKFWIWWWLFKNRKLIEKADIIHAHDVAFWYGPFRFLYFKKPFYITFHGYEQYPLSQKAILIRKISEKLAVGNICVGDFMPKWYGTKANFITYGAVANKYCPKAPNNSRQSAIFIGRLDEQTGIMTYLRLLKICKEKGIDLPLIVCGDGSFREKMEKFIKENKLDVQILGFIDNPEKYLSQVRFAFVSRYLAILEAMASRRLVFASYDNPLKKDYLRMAPFAKWIIIESSAEAMYNKLAYYRRHPKEEKKMVEAAYNWAKEQTWEKMVDICLKLWKIK